MSQTKLTEKQKQQLAILEPMLKVAADSRDYEKAKDITVQIQNVLRPTGHETRLMQSKNRLFEVAMESGHIRTAIPGFIGVRNKVSKRTRLYLEATTLLAICFLRKKDLNSARPYMVESLNSENNIKSIQKRTQYRVALAERFDQEALLAGLSSPDQEQLNPDKIQDEAGKLIYEKHEDEILELLGGTVPKGAESFINDVHKESQGLLTYEEKKKLPSPVAFKERKKLGKNVLSAFQSVLWHSLCDKDSEVYKMWFTNGMQALLDRKYLAAAIGAALYGLGIGVKAIAVYVLALIIKMGIETFCSLYRPSNIMGLR